MSMPEDPDPQFAPSEINAAWRAGAISMPPMLGTRCWVVQGFWQSTSITSKEVSGWGAPTFEAWVVRKISPSAIPRW